MALSKLCRGLISNRAEISKGKKIEDPQRQPSCRGAIKQVILESADASVQQRQQIWLFTECFYNGQPGDERLRMGMSSQHLAALCCEDLQYRKLMLTELGRRTAEGVQPTLKDALITFYITLQTL